MDKTTSATGRFGNTGAYGTRLAESFRLPDPPFHIHRSLQSGALAVSELTNSGPLLEPSASLGYDDAFLVTVQFKSLNHEFWLNGRSIPCDAISAGMTYIHDLRQDPRALVRGAAQALHFYIPLSQLNMLAQQNDKPAISDLVHKHTIGRDDPVMRFLGQSVLAAFRAKHKAIGLVLDEMLYAACAHVFGQYVPHQFSARRGKTGLAPWQESLAKEMMDINKNVSLPELAKELGLSVTHFAHAFRQSTGISPHQWLLARRIKKAEMLLAKPTLPLSEIALICGFSSQSHFNYAFKDRTGVSPGQWRRVIAGRTSGQVTPWNDRN